MTILAIVEMTKETVLSVEFIYCACGCGKTTSKYIFINGDYRKYKPKRYIRDHYTKSRIGDKNQRWNDGEQNNRGYEYKKIGYNKYKPKHQLIYEQTHRVCLLPWIEIHHINEVRDDNRICNLQAMTHSKHQLLHLQKNRINNISKRLCSICGNKTQIRTVKEGYTYQVWHKNPDDKSKWICRKCYNKIMWVKLK